MLGLWPSSFRPQHTSLLKPEIVRWFRANMTEGLEEARLLRLAILAATKESTAGPDLSADSFGHNQDSLEPAAGSTRRTPIDQVFILLTESHPRSPAPFFANINQVRRQFHSLAVQALMFTALKRQVEPMMCKSPGTLCESFCRM